MKKILSIVALLCGLATLGNAQFFKSLQSKRFFFGVRAGVNLSQLQTNTVNFSEGLSGLGNVTGTLIKANEANYTGWTGGVWMRIGHRFYIQPELLVSAKGGKISFMKYGYVGAPVSVVEASYTSFDVPVLVGLKLGPVRINAGPVASLAISENAAFKDAIKQYSSQITSELFKQATFGYQAGVGVDLGSLNLDLRYQSSFTDVSNAGPQSINNPLRSRASVWQLTLGYVIF